jgi:hypothetical protein
MKYFRNNLIISTLSSAQHSMRPVVSSEGWICFPFNFACAQMGQEHFVQREVCLQAAR